MDWAAGGGGRRGGGARAEKAMEEGVRAAWAAEATGEWEAMGEGTGVAGEGTGAAGEGTGSAGGPRPGLQS